jgi:hypothetical protein
MSDNSDDKKKFISIKKFKIQFPSSLSLPLYRRDFYASGSNNKEIIKENSNKEIGGDESVNIEKSVEKIIEEDLEKIVEKIVEEIVEEIVRIRNNREIKKIK